MKKIITVSREFGSGGRTIAKKLAERLGYKYYDKELVEQVALESGFDAAFIAEHSEFAPKKSGLGFMFTAESGSPLTGGMSTADFLWCVQREVILKLAEGEPCVIVGRCADYILKDRPDALHVFIHAPLAYRIDHVLTHYGQSDVAPEVRLEDKGKRRSQYYRRYTGREWGMSENYNISLDTSLMSVDRCVDIIEEMVKQ